MKKIYKKCFLKIKIKKMSPPQHTSMTMIDDLYHQLIQHANMMQGELGRRIRVRARELYKQKDLGRMRRLYNMNIRKVSAAGLVQHHTSHIDHPSVPRYMEVQGQYIVYPNVQAQYFSNFDLPQNQQYNVLAHSYPLYSNFGLLRM
jgi:hypothetical protein